MTTIICLVIFKSVDDDAAAVVGGPRYSDNRPSQWLRTLTPHNRRFVARWSLQLQNSNLIPLFIKTTSNLVADCLSSIDRNIVHLVFSVTQVI